MLVWLKTALSLLFKVQSNAYLSRPLVFFKQYSPLDVTIIHYMTVLSNTEWADSINPQHTQVTQGHVQWNLSGLPLLGELRSVTDRDTLLKPSPPSVLWLEIAVSTATGYKTDKQGTLLGSHPLLLGLTVTGWLTLRPLLMSKGLGHHSVITCPLCSLSVVTLVDHDSLVTSMLYKRERWRQKGHSDQLKRQHNECCIY